MSLKEHHCGICKRAGVKLWIQKSTTTINGKKYTTEWGICKECSTIRQMRHRYMRMSIFELDKLKAKHEKNLNILTSVLSVKLSEQELRPTKGRKGESK